MSSTDDDQGPITDPEPDHWPPYPDPEPVPDQAPQHFAKRYVEILKEFPGPRSMKRTTPQEQQQRRTQTLLAKHALGQQVVADLHFLRPRPVWERPAEVPDDDLEAWSTAKLVARKGQRAQAKDREVAQALGKWLYEVGLVEAGNASTLMVLLDTVATFRELGEPTLQPQIDKIRLHVKHTWKADIDEAPFDEGFAELEKWAKAKSRRESVCPTWLLNRNKPPAFSPRAYGSGDDAPWGIGEDGDDDWDD